MASPGRKPGYPSDKERRAAGRHRQRVSYSKTKLENARARLIGAVKEAARSGHIDMLTEEERKLL